MAKTFVTITPELRLDVLDKFTALQAYQMALEDMACTTKGGLGLRLDKAIRIGRSVSVLEAYIAGLEDE